MSVQTTQQQIDRTEIARAKLITGLIALVIMATSCAPQMIREAQQAHAQHAASAAAAG